MADTHNLSVAFYMMVKIIYHIKTVSNIVYTCIHKHTYKFVCKNYMLKFRDMVTVQNVGVIFDNVHVTTIFTCGNFVYKWIIKLQSGSTLRDQRARNM
jgi:hypothetical protein